MSVRDGRKAGFVWASTDALAHLRAHWDLKAPGADKGLGVYHALTEIANEDKARTAIRGDSDQFRTSQKEIGERACVSSKTVSRACTELERIGLLVIEADCDGDNRPGRPSFYTLVEPGETSVRSSDVEGGQRRKGCLTPSEATSDLSAKGGTGLRTSLYRGRRKEKKQEGARVVETEESVSAWEAAKELLRRQLPPAKFDQVRELAAAGECDGCLILVDLSDQGAADWRDRAEPVILEAIAGFDAVEILDEHELEQAAPLSEWDVWLSHFHQVTGRTAMTGSKEARKLFAGRRRDNGAEDPPRSLEELKLATIGAHGDDYLRRQGLDKPETILRESNIGRYIELGKAATGAAGARPVGDPALARITERPA